MSTDLAVIMDHGVPQLAPPNLTADAGPAAGFAFEEFFLGRLRNSYTRRAYLFVVRSFLNWVEGTI